MRLIFWMFFFGLATVSFTRVIIKGSNSVNNLPYGTDVYSDSSDFAAFLKEYLNGRLGNPEIFARKITKRSLYSGSQSIKTADALKELAKIEAEIAKISHESVNARKDYTTISKNLEKMEENFAILEETFIHWSTQMEMMAEELDKLDDQIIKMDEAMEKMNDNVNELIAQFAYGQ